MNYRMRVLCGAVLMAAKGRGSGGGGSKAQPPVPVKPGGAVEVISGDVPDYLKGKTQGAGRGSENVGTEDLVIPRLELLQGLSPQVQEGKPEFIPGAKPGMLFNSVTKQLYGSEVFVINVHYTKQYLVWKDRTKGGGFFGSYPTPKEAQDRAAQEGGEKAGVQVIDTPTHLCLLLNRNRGTVEEIIISMPRTKAKVSRNWNSMIRLAGGDRFSRVYRVASVDEKNAKGEYKNLVIAQSGYPTQAAYQMAEKLYASVSKGERNVVMDTTGFDAGPEGGGEGDGNTEM